MHNICTRRSSFRGKKLYQLSGLFVLDFFEFFFAFKKIDVGSFSDFINIKCMAFFILYILFNR